MVLSSKPVNDPLDIYSDYLAGFTKGLLGETYKGIRVNEDHEIQHQVAATLGVYDARRGIQPAPAPEVGDRVQRLLGGPQSA